MLYFLIIVAVLTLAAGGAGFLSGLRIVSSAQEGGRSKAPEPVASAAPQHAEGANLRPLSPIVTSLAGSPPVWIRIEASLVFGAIPKDVDVLAARISEDIIAFLRTVTVKQLEGATGFQHLSEDLNDRVRVRSDGRVQELVIQGLIIE